MSQKNYCIRLDEERRRHLEKIVRKGKEKARTITRCRILLLADEAQGKTDEEIAGSLGVCLATVFNVRRRYAQSGLEESIHEAPRSGQPVKFCGKTMAKITALACSQAPGGYARWSLRLLADRLVELDIVESISHASVGNILKKRIKTPS